MAALRRCRLSFSTLRTNGHFAELLSEKLSHKSREERGVLLGDVRAPFASTFLLRHAFSSSGMFRCERDFIPSGNAVVKLYFWCSYIKVESAIWRSEAPINAHLSVNAQVSAGHYKFLPKMILRLGWGWNPLSFGYSFTFKAGT